MRLVLVFTLLVSALSPRAAATPVLTLSVDKTQVTPAEVWTYTLEAADTDEELTIIDPIDLRLEISGMSASCEEPDENVARCVVRASEAVTISVRVRRNACEPDVCRNIDWWIGNQVQLAGDANVTSNRILVHVTRQAFGRPQPGPQPGVWLPIVLTN